MISLNLYARVWARREGKRARARARKMRDGSVLSDARVREPQLR